MGPRCPAWFRSSCAMRWKAARPISISSRSRESPRVRYRIDGVLRTSLALPIYVHPALVSRIKGARQPQDRRDARTAGWPHLPRDQWQKIDFRISTLPVVDNEKVVMRVLDTTSSAPSRRSGWAIRAPHVALIKEEVKKSHGMFLVTGPTGSGKSTTLFAVLSQLNADGVNISTLEDRSSTTSKGEPVTDPAGDRLYLRGAGLRAPSPGPECHHGRRDPRQGEAAGSRYASLTGHLVFSTLHTNDVYGIVPRLVDMGVEPFLIAQP